MQDSKTQPGLPLPPPITSDEPGTWSYDTMSRRVVEIARRTLVENLFSEEIGSRVEALISDIPEGKIRLWIAQRQMLMPGTRTRSLIWTRTG